MSIFNNGKYLIRCFNQQLKIPVVFTVFLLMIAVNSFSTTAAAFSSVDSPEIDSVKLKLLLKNYSNNKSLEEGANILREIIQMQVRAGNEGQEAVYYVQLGRHYQMAEQYHLALKYFMEGYKIFFSQNDITAIAYTLSDIANIYFAQGFYDMAIVEYRKQLLMFRSVANTHGIAVAMNNIALCHQAEDRTDSALFWFNKALETRRLLNDPYLIAHSKIYIGRVHFDKNELNRADSNIKEALYVLYNKPQIDLNDSLLISAALRSQAAILVKMGDKISAIKTFETALKFYKILTDRGYVRVAMDYIMFLLDIGKQKEAMTYLQQALSMSKHRSLHEEYYSAVRVKCYELNKSHGNMDTLTYYLDQLAIVTDTLLNSRRYSRVNEIRLALDVMQHEFDAQKQQSVSQNRIRVALTIAIAAMGGLLLIVFFFRRERRSERRFRQLADSTFEAIVIHHNNKILRVNKSFTALVQLDENDVSNRPFSSFFSSSEFNRLSDLFSTTADFEDQATLLIGPDVSAPVELLNRPISFKGKTFNITAIRDITTLNRALQENKLLRTAVEQNAVVVVMTDAKGVINYVNKKFSDVTGYTFQEAVGLKPSVLKSGHHNDLFYSNLWRTITAGNSWKGEFLNKKKNGELYWENALITPVKDLKGVVTHFIAIKEDITVQKHIEKELMRRTNMYRELVRQLPKTAVFLYDLNHKYLLVEGPLLSDLGVQSIDYEGKEPGVIINSPGVVTRLHEMMSNTFLGHSDFEELHINNRIYDLQAIPVRESFEEIDLGMMVLRDITDERGASLKIVESEALLRELNATKDKFFNILAHDLKNPFNIILGYADLLTGEFEVLDDKSKKEYIRQISIGADSAYRLLNNLLEWARAQTGSIHFEQQPVQLLIPLRNSMQVVEPQAQAKGIKIDVNIDQDHWIFADINMVKTVFRNLLTNAVKFSNPNTIVAVYSEILEPGHPDIQMDANSRFVKITVEDQGVGIEFKDLQRLFKVGEKVRTDGTAKETGTGLGLLLCHEFVQRNQGRIWVTSKPGSGSKFMFILPEAVQ